VILIIIVVFVARKFASGDGSSTKTVASNASVKRHTDQELKNMSFDEWKELDVATMKRTDTKVLKIYLRQYEDLKTRIEDNHPETMENLDKQGIERSLASLEHTKEELRRRNA